MSNKFKNQFQNECRSDEFKTTIKTIIDDRMFFQNLFQKYYLAGNINDEIRSQLPRETNKIVTPIIESKLSTFTLTTLPQLVNNQLNVQLPAYLNNHSQMIDILNKHTTNLESKLTDASHKVMVSVVNDKKYNKLSDLHFNEIHRKSDIKLVDIQKQIDNQIVSIKSAVDKDMSDLKSSLNTIDQLHNKVNSLQNTLIAGNVIITAIGIAGLGYYWLYSKNNKFRK